MLQTKEYWDKRAIKRLTDTEKISDEYINRIKKIYDRAYRNIDDEIRRVYNNYSKETGLDIQKLKELLTKKETDKVWKTLKRQGLDKYIKNNYKSRISRLEQIQAQIYANAKLIYPKEELQNTMCYKGVINDSYYKAIYDTQVGMGYDFSFSKIDKNVLTALLNEKWSGKNYSQRIWGNTDILAYTISKVVGGGILSGQSIEKTSKQLRDRFQCAKYYAERLVRTEANHFHNIADAMAYKEMGVDKYVFVAVLDSRTSELCQSMDNKVFEYKNKETGVNFPPLHPNCRSKTRGYLGEEVEKMLQRRARNTINGKNEIIDNISYNDWAKEHLMYANEQKNGENISSSLITRNNDGKILTLEECKNIIENHGISFVTEDLKAIDNKLLSDNTKRLDELLNKYSIMKEHIKDKNMYFGAKNFDDKSTIAEFGANLDNTKLSLCLSKRKCKDYDEHISLMKNDIEVSQSMPCSDNKISVYSITHEFGHFIENKLIEEYKKEHLAEFFEMKTRALNATTLSKSSSIVRKWNIKIGDIIADEIYKIALKNNPNFSFSNNLSKYGRTNSLEFFAESFANMECGKSNELGEAMKIYLKKRGIL